MRCNLKGWNDRSRQASRSGFVEVCEAFELIFSLLRHIDEGLDDVIFFADEGGSWQVWVDWAVVLSAWFKCLSLCTEPGEYARKVVATVDEFDRFNREKHLAAARRSATSAQRKALTGD